jgi:hypothetical protein
MTAWQYRDTGSQLYYLIVKIWGGVGGCQDNVRCSSVVTSCTFGKLLLLADVSSTELWSISNYLHAIRATNCYRHAPTPLSTVTNCCIFCLRSAAHTTDRLSWIGNWCRRFSWICFLVLVEGGSAVSAFFGLSRNLRSGSCVKIYFKGSLILHVLPDLISQYFDKDSIASTFSMFFLVVVLEGVLSGLKNRKLKHIVVHKRVQVRVETVNSVWKTTTKKAPTFVVFRIIGDVVEGASENFTVSSFTCVIFVPIPSSCISIIYLSSHIATNFDTLTECWLGCLLREQKTRFEPLGDWRCLSVCFMAL